MQLKHIVFGLFCFSMSMTASAAMIVDRAIVHYEAGGLSRQDVQIQNPDPDPLYVKVEILEVKNPGAENEERVVVKNPRDAKFLVTPNKLVVPPGGRKLIRLVNLDKLGNDERVFRVNLVPVTPDVEAEQTAVKVLVGYQLLVLIQPNSPTPDLKVERSGKKVTFYNAGNTNLLLRSGVQCAPAPQSGVCEELASRRLYAGNKWVLDLKYDTPLEYIVASAVGNEKIVH